VPVKTDPSGLWRAFEALSPKHGVTAADDARTTHIAIPDNMFLIL
jgi:hypothetical protein